MSNVIKFKSKPVGTLSNIIKGKPAWRLSTKPSVIEFIKAKYVPVVMAKRETHAETDRISRIRGQLENINTAMSGLKKAKARDLKLDLIKGAGFDIVEEVDGGLTFDACTASYDMTDISKKKYNQLCKFVDNGQYLDNACRMYMWDDASGYEYKKANNNGYIALTVVISDFANVPVHVLEGIIDRASDTRAAIDRFLGDIVA